MPTELPDFGDVDVSDTPTMADTTTLTMDQYEYESVMINLKTTIKALENQIEREDHTLAAEGMRDDLQEVVQILEAATVR